MDLLWPRFHALPVELREKICRFTYKPQSKALLQEIKEWGDDREFLENFTARVQKCNSFYGFHETTDGVHAELGEGLQKLRLHPRQKLLLKNWVYRTEFQLSVKEHTNGEKSFDLLSEESSFSLHFWMCIYH